MKLARRHLSFANVISMTALFVALGGASYAAITIPKNSVTAKQIKKNAVAGSEIKKNAVGGSEIKANAVGASEIKDNAVGTSEITTNAVTGDEVADNAVNSGEIAGNAVGTGEIADGSVGTGDITNGSLLSGDFAADQLGPTAYARVNGSGVLIGGVTQRKGVDQADIQHDAGAATAELTGDGIYCFGGLGFTVKSATVSYDNTDTLPAVPALTGGTLNRIASVAVQKGEDFGRCNAGHNQVRVAIQQVNEATVPTLVNGGFFIWLQG
jgi:hypothetical protein